MRESIVQSVRSSFTNGWGNLPASRKMTIGLVAAAVIAGIIGLALWSSRPDYKVLYTNLAPEDMQAVEDELRLAGVSSKLSPDGSAIMIPSSETERIRWRFAEKGIPQAGKFGFEIFDEQGIFDTEGTQRIKYQRALQVELARTIEQNSQIKAARVHLVLPRPSVFVENEQPTTASVSLLLRSASRLNMGQVDAIVFLVAGAVEGLQRDNVTVIAAGSGEILSRSDRDSYVDGRRLSYMEAIESRYEAKVRDLLTPVLGYGNATVQVAAEIDFKSVTTKATTYAPETVPRSEEINEYTSKSGGSSGNASGVPGVTTSITPGARSGADWPEYTRSDSTTEYEVGSTETDTIEPPGSVTKLSFSVVVNEEVVNAKSLDMKAIEDAVKGAAIDATRDVITVTKLPFDTSLEQELDEKAKTAKREQLYGTIMKAAIGIAIFVFLLFVLRAMMRRTAPSEDTLALPEFPPMSLSPAETGALATDVDMALQEAEPQSESEFIDELPQDLSKADMDRQMILDMLKQDPERVARVIRGWLTE